MVAIETILESVQTGSGFWHPIVWVSAIVLALLVIYILRGIGKKEYKEGTGQTQSFLSGNLEYEKEQMHVPGGNLYWGFTESMKWGFNILKKMHTGNASDYVLWFVVVMALLFILIGVI